MGGLAASPTALRQVALAGGGDLDEPELLAFADAAAGADVALMSPPAVKRVDSASQFGPAGEAERMASQG
jgi:hypothetical protein